MPSSAPRRRRHAGESRNAPMSALSRAIPCICREVGEAVERRATRRRQWRAAIAGCTRCYPPRQHSTRNRSMPERILSGQTAWITGSSRGLGRAMAEELCRLGAMVAVHGTRPDSPKTFGEGESMQQLAGDLARKHDAETMPVWGDVCQEGEVRRVAAEIRQRWGRIDLLVCCAGGDIGAAGTGVGRGGRPENDDCLN